METNKHALRLSTYNGTDNWLYSNSVFTLLRKAIINRQKYYYIDLFINQNGKFSIKLIFIRGKKNRNGNT